MSVTVHELKRTFQYDKKTLPDPDPKMSPEEVKSYYSARYPELTQAIIEGPEYENDKATYTFSRSVGTKGAIGGERLAKTMTLSGLVRDGMASYLETVHPDRKEEQCLTGHQSEKLHRILLSGERPVLPKSHLLPMLP